MGEFGYIFLGLEWVVGVAVNTFRRVSGIDDYAWAIVKGTFSTSYECFSVLVAGRNCVLTFFMYN